MRDLRLMVTDLDGTLLDPVGAVSGRVREAITLLHRRDVLLAVATGRRWTGASLIAADIGLEGPVAHYDGAVIRDFPSGRMLAAAYLDTVLARRAVRLLADAGLQPVAQYSGEDGEYLYAADGCPHPEWADRYLTTFRHQTRLLPAHRIVTTDLPVVRILAMGPIPLLRRAAVAARRIGCGAQVAATPGATTGDLTVHSPKASKGAAVASLAALLGVGLDQTAAIGDAGNDVTMLRVAGLGIAMGHATPRVRAAADAVTLSNADDGFAVAVETLMTGKEQAGRRLPRLAGVAAGAAASLYE